MSAIRRILGLAILLSLLVPAATARADQETIPFDYTQLTDDGRHIFVMLATVSYGQQDPEIRATYAQSGLYLLSDTSTPLWTVDWYAFPVDLSFDGRYVVREGNWPRKYDYGALAVAFYDQGQLLRAYSVADLVVAPPLLVHSESHYFWRADWLFDPAQNQLTVETEAGDTYLFDITTGQVVNRQLASVRRPIYLGGFCVSVLGTILLIVGGVIRGRRRRTVVG